MDKNIAKPNLRKRITLSSLISIFVLSGIYFSVVLFAPTYSVPSDAKVYLHVYENDNINTISIRLEKIATVRQRKSFKKAASLLQYRIIRTGRYEITPNMSNFELIRNLRSGRQTPVRLTFNNIRTKEQLASRLSTQLMTDSASIILLLNDNLFLSNYDVNSANAVSLFIPDTYEVFWDIKTDALFDRMKKEYDWFWTEERKRKAQDIGLTPLEVATLASIVEEETNQAFERPIVAGLYINRLRKGMLLQADPTVKFAVGDVGLRRILRIHLQTESPYNTYKYKGLPPGPIRIATGKGIDAVLNYEHHNYLFMCAKETLNGEHNFAETLQQHNINAKKYQQALNKLQIFQ